MTASEGRFGGVSGVRIFYRAWRPARPRGVVVVVHGFNAHSGHYAWAAEQLTAHGLAVHALDLRGRGRSDGERFYVDQFSDYVDDVASLVRIARSDASGLPVFLLGHSAGGVVACLYAVEHQAELAGLICESFAFRLPAPDFALAVLKGLSHLAPHAHVLHLKNEDFSRDPNVVAAMNADPLIAHETQPTKTVAQLVLADERLKSKHLGIIAGTPPATNMARNDINKDSPINCLISLALPDPNTFRTPTSLARCSDLAVARFMKLMQAINKIITAISEKSFTYFIFPPSCFPSVK